MAEELSRMAVVHAVNGARMAVAVATQGCSACGQKKSCGIGKLTSERPSTLIDLPAEPGLRAGDRVTLSIDSAAVNRAALLGYLLPAALLVVGALCGDALGNLVGNLVGGMFGATWLASLLPATMPLADSGAALGAIVGTVIGVLLVRLGSARLTAVAVRRE